MLKKVMEFISEEDIMFFNELVDKCDDEMLEWVLAHSDFIGGYISERRLQRRATRKERMNKRIKEELDELKERTRMDDEEREAKREANRRAFEEDLPRVWKQKVIKQREWEEENDKIEGEE